MEKFFRHLQQFSVIKNSFDSALDVIMQIIFSCQKKLVVINTIIKLQFKLIVIEILKEQREGNEAKIAPLLEQGYVNYDN